MNKRLFVLDDDADLVRLLSDLLKKEGYQVESGAEPLAAYNTVRSQLPDLILLDIRMDGMNGLEFCKKLKGDPLTHSILVVMMSAKTEEADVVAGLELGAEDYIRKPIQKSELLARVRTVLRRKESPVEGEKIVLGPLEIDLRTYTARIHGKLLDLRLKEFELLAYLARREGGVVTRTTLSHAVWKHDHLPTSKTIDVHIHELKKKLGDYGRWIEALRGVGYRFEVDE